MQSNFFVLPEPDTYTNIFEPGKLTLYRGDSRETPPTWDSSFKNSIYCYPQVGEKNKEGFIFLTNSIDIAKHYTFDIGFITTCTTKKELRIIDFSYCYNVFQMLLTLHYCGINVINEHYKLYNNTSASFKDFFEKSYNNLVDLIFPDHNNEENIVVNKLITEINDDIEKLNIINYNHVESVGLLAQRLSDFDNGILFKNTLIEKKFSGYRFKEGADPRGHTYCILSSEYLTEPHVTFYKSDFVEILTKEQADKVVEDYKPFLTGKILQNYKLASHHPASFTVNDIMVWEVDKLKSTIRLVDKNNHEINFFRAIRDYNIEFDINKYTN